MIAKTPTPPYYAVIFSSIRTDNNLDYDKMANKMIELAKEQSGFLGVESARNELGITVSYWKDLKSIKKWKENSDHKIAQERGLANIKTTPYALEGFVSEHSKSLFANQKVLNERETEARYEVMQETYINKIHTEAELLIELTQTYVLPSAVSHLDEVLAMHKGLTDIGLINAALTVKNEVGVFTDFQDNVRLYLFELKAKVSKAQAIKDITKRSKFYADQIQVLFDPIRENADEIEKIVSEQSWKLPRYRDMLFI